MSEQARVLEPCTRPTMYFVGVTTGQSSIMRVFPRWAAVLGLDAIITGYDAPLNAPAADYRAIVEHIRRDPLAQGALVTTHKIDLLRATRDLFGYLDPNAELCGEISCISKRDGQLQGYAKDPISSGLAWQHFIPAGHFGSDASSADVLCLGAGGAAVAISIYLAGRADAADRPRRFVAVDIDQGRLDHLRGIHAQLDTDVQFEYVLSESAARNDAIMAALPARSVVINATGMGKDRPGSPLTDVGLFPINGFAWELNYRGERDFMHQALRQESARGVTVEDGWVYFLHGWTQVIAEVFDLDLTPALFGRLDEAASTIRG